MGFFSQSKVRLDDGIVKELKIEITELKIAESVEEGSVFAVHHNDTSNSVMIYLVFEYHQVC